MLAVDLVADLQRVAAVDEDRRFLRQHHRRAGRALEAGQPGQPLGVGADIFAHMLVGQRHDEAVEPVGLQLLAQRGEAVRIGGHYAFSRMASIDPRLVAKRALRQSGASGTSMRLVAAILLLIATPLAAQAKCKEDR